MPSLALEPDADAAPSRPGAPRPSFSELFEEQFRYVHATLRRLGIPERDLEDVAHDVFLEIHRKLETFDASRPLRPWLFAFAFRMAAGYRRRARHRREVLDSEEEAVDPAPGAVDLLLRSEAIELARRALDEVELSRRAVFILHELDGCPIPEVASVLEIPLNTAYSRLRLARQDFARAVRRLRRARGEP